MATDRCFVIGREPASGRIRRRADPGPRCTWIDRQGNALFCQLLARPFLRNPRSSHYRRDPQQHRRAGLILRASDRFQSLRPPHSPGQFGRLGRKEPDSLLSNGSVSTEPPAAERIGWITIFSSLYAPLAASAAAPSDQNRSAGGGSLMNSLPWHIPPTDRFRRSSRLSIALEKNASSQAGSTGKPSTSRPASSRGPLERLAVTPTASRGCRDELVAVQQAITSRRPSSDSPAQALFRISTPAITSRFRLVARMSPYRRPFAASLVFGPRHARGQSAIAVGEILVNKSPPERHPRRRPGGLVRSGLFFNRHDVDLQAASRARNRRKNSLSVLTGATPVPRRW